MNCLLGSENYISSIVIAMPLYYNHWFNVAFPDWITISVWVGNRAVWGSLAGCLCVTSGEGVLRLWSLPWASPWSVHGVGPREGKVWAFWGVKLCSPSKYPKSDMWSHQTEWEGC